MNDDDLDPKWFESPLTMLVVTLIGAMAFVLLLVSLI